MNIAFIEIDGVIYEKVDDFKCPCCGVGLWISRTGISTEQNPVTIFCAKGSCQSQVTNNGASGKDIEEAIANLTSAVEEERMREYWKETLVTDEDFEDMEHGRNNLIRNGL